MAAVVLSLWMVPAAVALAPQFLFDLPNRLPDLMQSQPRIHGCHCVDKWWLSSGTAYRWRAKGTAEFESPSGNRFDARLHHTQPLSEQIDCRTDGVQRVT